MSTEYSLSLVYGISLNTRNHADALKLIIDEGLADASITSPTGLVQQANMSEKFYETYDKLETVPNYDMINRRLHESLIVGVKGSLRSLDLSKQENLGAFPLRLNELSVPSAPVEMLKKFCRVHGISANASWTLVGHIS